MDACMAFVEITEMIEMAMMPEEEFDSEIGEGER